MNRATKLMQTGRLLNTQSYREQTALHGTLNILPPIRKKCMHHKSSLSQPGCLVKSVIRIKQAPWFGTHVIRGLVAKFKITEWNFLSFACVSKSYHLINFKGGTFADRLPSKTP